MGSTPSEIGLPHTPRAGSSSCCWTAVLNMLPHVVCAPFSHSISLILDVLLTPFFNNGRVTVSQGPLWQLWGHYQVLWRPHFLTTLLVTDSGLCSGFVFTHLSAGMQNTHIHLVLLVLMQQNCQKHDLIAAWWTCPDFVNSRFYPIVYIQLIKYEQQHLLDGKHYS